MNRRRWLPRSRARRVWIRRLAGLSLLGWLLVFFGALLATETHKLVLVGWLAACGLYLAWPRALFAKRSRRRKAARSARRFATLGRWVGAALVAGAIVLMWPSSPKAPPLAWEAYGEASFELAQRSGEPILVDVYADWCVPCVEMDHVTFPHPGVSQALASVRRFRLDVTRPVKPEGQRFLERYYVFGAPTVLLFDRSGRERSDLRVEGFIRPNEFLRRLSQLQ